MVFCFLYSLRTSQVYTGSKVSSGRLTLFVFEEGKISFGDFQFRLQNRVLFFLNDNIVLVLF